MVSAMAVTRGHVQANGDWSEARAVRRRPRTLRAVGGAVAGSCGERVVVDCSLQGSANHQLHSRRSTHLVNSRLGACGVVGRCLPVSQASRMAGGGHGHYTGPHNIFASYRDSNGLRSLVKSPPRVVDLVPPEGCVVSWRRGARVVDLGASACPCGSRVRRPWVL